MKKVLPIYASTAILIVMSHDRYAHLNSSAKRSTWSLKRSFFKIALAWAISFFISLPQLFLFKIGTITFNGQETTTCFVKWSSLKPEIIYILYHTIIQYILPIILMVYFFTSIYLNVSSSHVKSSNKEIKKLVMNSEESTVRRSYRRSYSESRIKTFKLTFTIVLTFTLCGLPFYSSTLFNVLFRENLQNYNLFGINISKYFFVLKT